MAADEVLVVVNLGVAARVKYGFLLEKMEGRLPVFRTESQESVYPLRFTLSLLATCQVEADRWPKQSHASLCSELRYR